MAIEPKAGDAGRAVLYHPPAPVQNVCSRVIPVPGTVLRWNEYYVMVKLENQRGLMSIERKNLEWVNP